MSLVYIFETMPTVTHQTQSSYIHRFPDLKLSWSGDYESLRSFVDSELNLQGKWTSTGGENKLFESDNVDIHWRAKKKFLRIEGKQASEVKRSLLMMIWHDTGFDDHISSSHNTCKCSEVSSDIEGVKLDITILESTVKQQANTLARMQEVMANLGTATTEAKSIPSDRLTPNSTSGERGMQCKNNSSTASVITPTRLRYSDEPEQNSTDGVVVTLVNTYLPSQSKSNSKSRLNNAPILENSCYDPHHNSKGMQGQLNTVQTIGKECVMINQHYNKNKGKHKKHNTHSQIP